MEHPNDLADMQELNDKLMKVEHALREHQRAAPEMTMGDAKRVIMSHVDDDAERMFVEMLFTANRLLRLLKSLPVEGNVT